ncbi:MAG: hypothetical protein WC489_03460 [Patescibacteria group bacterium]
MSRYDVDQQAKRFDNQIRIMHQGAIASIPYDLALLQLTTGRLTPYYEEQEAVDWSAQSTFERYSKQIERTCGSLHIALQHSLQDAFQYLPDGCTIAEFGSGTGTMHPLAFLPSDAQLIAIDPNREAVMEGVTAGRIPENVIIMDQDSPPYELPYESGRLNGLFGISSFHVVSRPELIAILSSLSSHLSPGEVISHVQHISPTRSFLQGWDEDTFSRIDRLFEKKYGIRTERIDLGKGNNALERYIKAVVDQIDLLKGCIYREGSCKVGNMPINVMESSRSKRNALSKIWFGAKRELKDEMENEAELNSHYSMYGVRAVGRAMENMLLVMQKYQGAEALDYIAAESILSFLQNVFLQDLFELYLVDILTELGYDTRYQKTAVSTHITSNRHVVGQMEGIDIVTPIELPFHGEIASVRSVTGRKTG